MKLIQSSHADLMSRCRAYISSSHISGQDREKVYPSITLSRMSGSGAFVIGQQLVEKLNKQRRDSEPEWTLFDKNLVEQIIQDHNLPKSLESFFSDEARTRMEDIMEEILDLHPETEKMVEQTTRTIIRLLRKGHVVIIGRGGNVIGGHLTNVTHVRLVAPLSFRLEHTVATCGLSPREAVDFIKRADVGRAKYIKRHFKCDINDPLRYDMVLNTASLGFDETIRLICDAMVHHRNQRKSSVESDVFQT